MVSENPKSFERLEQLREDIISFFRKKAKSNFEKPNALLEHPNFSALCFELAKSLAKNENAGTDIQTLSDFSEELKQEIKVLWDNGQTVFAYDHDAPIAMLSYKRFGNHSAPVFMLTRGVSLPEHQGKGRNLELTEQLVMNIKTKFPKASILSVSKNEKVHKKYHKLGWPEITLPECEALLNSDDKAAGSMQIIRDEGYRAFMLYN